SIRRIEVLVNDLLNVSFLEMGMFSLQYSRCNMVELCQRLIEEYAVGTNPPPTILIDAANESIEAYVDVERIGQVILNLLSNARKYSSVGSPTQVSLRQHDTTYSISICDSGVGIPSELLPHIFDRFYRAPGIEVQTGSSVGFGLGL